MTNKNRNRGEREQQEHLHLVSEKPFCGVNATSLKCNWNIWFEKLEEMALSLILSELVFKT